MKNDSHQPLLPDQIYHLFSRAVGNEKLFLSDDNYRFFLQKLHQHTGVLCGLYAYSLVPNHFHLLVRMNEDKSIIQNFETVKNKTYCPSQHNLADFIMERFSNFLNSYTKAFNKVYQRKGGLFIDYLNRTAVNKDTDFANYVWQIHKNAVHHQITNVIGNWPHDSYLSLLGEAPTLLLRKEVIDWFGGREMFIRFHQQTIYSRNLKDL